MEQKYARTDTIVGGVYCLGLHDWELCIRSVPRVLSWAKQGRCVRVLLGVEGTFELSWYSLFASASWVKKFLGIIHQHKRH